MTVSVAGAPRTGCLAVGRTACKVSVVRTTLIAGYPSRTVRSSAHLLRTAVPESQQLDSVLLTIAVLGLTPSRHCCRPSATESGQLARDRSASSCKPLPRLDTILGRSPRTCSARIARLLATDKERRVSAAPRTVLNDPDRPQPAQANRMGPLALHPGGSRVSFPFGSVVGSSGSAPCRDAGPSGERSQ